MGDVVDDKTYVADVAFESISVGEVFVSPETERLTALLGAGYIHEVVSPVYATDDWLDEDDDSRLLERFEELDEVEVIGEKPRRGRKPKAE